MGTAETEPETETDRPGSRGNADTHDSEDAKSSGTERTGESWIG